MINASILVVEDDPVTAESTSIILEKFGYGLSAIASSAEQALDAAQNRHPDLALVNIKLNSDMDGVDVARKILADFNIPVVYVTAYADDEVVDRVKTTEHLGYLVKPFKEKELHEIIQSAMSRISERKLKQSEESMKESAERFRSLVSALPEMIWISSTDKGCTFFNQSWLCFTGRTMEDEIGDGWSTGIYPNDRQRCLGIYNEAFDKQEPFTIEYRFRRFDGEYRWIVNTGNPWYTASNQFLGYVGSCMDISDRKRTEEALADSERRFRNLMEQAADAFYLHDFDGKIIDVNHVACENLGYDRNELLMKSVTDIEKERSIREMKKSWRGLKPGVPITIQGVHRRKNGSEFPIEAQVGLIKQDESYNILELVRDITVRKRMEEDLLRAQKLESIGVLAGGIAHDFNNLLTGIAGNISLALRRIDYSDKNFEVLIRAQKATDSAHSITQRLLTFSTGGAPLKKTVLTHQMIQDITSFTLHGSKSKATITTADDLWITIVDEGQFNQAIQNIVINADQAMENGGEISIKLVNSSLANETISSLRAGNYVKITIRDRGIGIPPDNRLKIFDPFFTTKSGGHGLGLSAAYSIIHSHHGYILAESEPEHGASIIIYLPAAKRTVDTKSKINTDITKGSILFMDDERYIQQMVQDVFADEGYDVVFAGDGDEAVGIYRQAHESGDPFDVVVLDLTIPGGMGGKDAITRLQKINPGVKAIITSGYSRDPIMANYREYGFSGVVPKPFKIEKLVDAVENLINISNPNFSETLSGDGIR